MNNNVASNFCGRVNRRNFEGTPTSEVIQSTGTHSKADCSGGWITCAQQAKRRTILGVVYFFANHSLWKSPIVKFPHDPLELDCSEWRIAVAGLGWTLGIDEDGSPTLFLTVMENDKEIQDNIELNSKRKATPVKLFGFTILPQYNDRVRTLVPYFTSKVCTSRVQCASKFQNLCPRGNRKDQLESNVKEGGHESEKKETVLVPTDPEYYIDKDAESNRSMRLCGVSFITPLSVSDEFAFVSNPNRKNNNEIETKANLQPCQNLSVSCLRKSNYVKITGANCCDGHFGKFNENITMASVERDKFSVENAHNVNENGTSISSIDIIKALCDKLSDREFFEKFKSENESKFIQSSEKVGNNDSSNPICKVSSAIFNYNLSRNQNIPRIPSDNILGIIGKTSVAKIDSCAPLINTAKLNSREENIFSLPLSASVKTEISSESDTSVDIESHDSKYFEDDTIKSSQQDSDNLITNLEISADMLKINKDNSHEKGMPCKKKLSNKPPLSKRYSQTKFPLDVICSGKIEEIKKRDSFIISSQFDHSVKRASVGDCAVREILHKLYPTKRSCSAGKVDLRNGISYSTKENVTLAIQDKQSLSSPDELNKEPKFLPSVQGEEELIASSFEFRKYTDFSKDLILRNSSININGDQSDTLMTSDQKIENENSSVFKSERFSTHRENHGSTDSKRLVIGFNCKQERELVDLKKNSVENLFKSYPNTSSESCNGSFNKPKDVTVSTSLFGNNDIKCEEILIPHEAVSCEDVKGQIHSSDKIKNIDRENIKIKEGELTLKYDKYAVNTLKGGVFIHSSPVSNHSVSVLQETTPSIPDAVEIINEQTLTPSFDNRNASNNKIDELRNPLNVFINSDKTSTKLDCLVSKNNINEQTTGPGSDKEQDDPTGTTLRAKSPKMQLKNYKVSNYIMDTFPLEELYLINESPHASLHNTLDDPSEIILTAKLSTMQVNKATDNDASNYSTYKNLFGEPGNNSELSDDTLDELDPKWMELVEQIMLDIFNWRQLSALVVKKTNSLGSDSMEVCPDRSIDSTLIRELNDESISSLEMTTKSNGNLSSYSEGNLTKDSFNACAFEANVDDHLRKQIYIADPLDSNPESFIDAICTSELPLKEDGFRNDEICDFGSLELLDCLQQSSLNDISTDITLLEPTFNPNSEEFYSNSYGTFNLQGDLQNVATSVIKEEFDDEYTYTSHYLGHSSNQVWGFDHGPVARRCYPELDEEWPPVWKPPEYESDQSGYETDEELDNMDEEMLRLEEKLRKFEEELGMSDDSSEYSHFDEEPIDLKYFPLKSSYSTSHIDKVIQDDKRNPFRKNGNVGTDCATGNENMSSNDLLFLSGAGFMCGNRRCFSASLAQGNTHLFSSITEMNEDLIQKKECNKRSVTAYNINNTTENCQLVDEEQSCALDEEEEIPYNNFTLLHTFSDGYLWYENDMALIDFENLCLVEDRLTSDVLFFIFEDEIIEDQPYEDFEIEDSSIIDKNQANSVIEDELMYDPSKGFDVPIYSSLGVTNQDLESYINSYNTFLPYNCLDRPCIPGDCTGQNSIHTLSVGQQDTTWEIKDIQLLNKKLLPGSNILTECDIKSSLYKNETSRMPPTNAYDLQKMSAICSDRSYVVDRSIVGHISDNYLNKKNRDVRVEGDAILEGTSKVNDANIACSRQKLFVDDKLICWFGDSSKKLDYILDTPVHTTESFTVSDTTTNVIEDNDVHNSTNYPQRPLRSKNRRSTKNSSSSDGVEGDSATSGNNQQGQAKHRWADEARYSRHRRK